MYIQVRPASTSVSSGAPDKAQATRTEQWTKDITDYLQQLLDEFLSKDGSAVPLSGRDQSSPGLMGLPPSAKHRAESSPVISEVEDTSFLFRWWYVVRLLQWHFAEGLILPSLVIEWVFAQLQVIILPLHAKKKREALIDARGPGKRKNLYFLVLQL